MRVSSALKQISYGMHSVNSYGGGIMQIHWLEEGFFIDIKGHDLLYHLKEHPLLTVGRGQADYDMYHGNFNIKDDIIEKFPLKDARVTQCESGYDIEFSDAGRHIVKVTLRERDGRITLWVQAEEPKVNRVWIRIPATPEESVYGGGEQFSYFNLRGRKFPLWVSEQGVGRNKRSLSTFLADAQRSGGDYYTTYFPQPTYVSSQKYALHVNHSVYMEFDFRKPDAHELEIWDGKVEFVLMKQESFGELLSDLTSLLGRQPALPDWAYDGVWLGLQGGTEVVLEKLQRALEHGLEVTGVWAQDWEGKRITSFGKQLMWNWRCDNQLYPGLQQEIRNLQQRGIRFLGYINPFLVEEGDLFSEASQKGYLVKNQQGEDYQVVITTFSAAMVDLTNPDAVAWIKQVIRENMIDFGLSGWMADFAEYLPTDAFLYSGESAEVLHNQWPVLWAKANMEAVEEAGRLGDIVYFSRSGYSGMARYSTLIWAGDQNVDWSQDDGLPSVITAALSAGMSGIGLHHSDIGGYTTLFEMKRSKELFMRWAELGAFTPVMRTHEGNRPDDNWQFDSDEETLVHYARMSKVHAKLKDYLKALAEDHVSLGFPVQRPLFFHYEHDKASYDLQSEYLLGPDLLVAPILEEGVSSREVYIPQDDWVHLWTGQRYSIRAGQSLIVQAELGYPPVFYRHYSAFRALFQEIQQVWGITPAAAFEAGS